MREPYKCPFTPLYDRVVFDEIVDEPSMLQLPAGVQSPKDKKLVVVAVGPGRLVNGEHVPLTVKVGDRITLTQNALQFMNAHYLTDKKEKGPILFSLQESYIAGVYND